MCRLFPNDHWLNAGANAIVVIAPKRPMNQPQRLTTETMRPRRCESPDSEAIAMSRTLLVRIPSEVAERSMSMAEL